MGISLSTKESITKDELKLVLESWSVVMQNPQENGIVIFRTFLEKYEYYSKFAKFSGIPKEELPEREVFRNHALAIMRAIDGITESINDEAKLKTQLVQLGRQHRRNKITFEQFKELQEVIIDILKNAFKLPPETLTAWNKVFEIAFQYVSEGLA